MAKPTIPDSSEPMVREGRNSAFWYRFFEGLTQAYNSTVDGIAGAIAEVADVYTATVGKTFTTDLIETASAYPSTALTDAASISVNWDSFINQQVTITANRALANPTNGQPGTYRCILVKGNSATLRTLTFGANYKGALPSLTDITSTKWYDLTIKCISTSHFTVSAQQAQ